MTYHPTFRTFRQQNRPGFSDRNRGDSRYREQAIPYSLFPIPYSLFPIPYSPFPIPYSLFPSPQSSSRCSPPCQVIGIDTDARTG
jgi:hypothetical protein